MGLEETDLGGGVSVGVFQQNDTAITTGFNPSYVAFYAQETQAALNTEYYSGASTGGGANSWAWSQGYAASSVAGDQLVNGASWNSNSINAHRAYAGDGEVVYVIRSSNAGENLEGRARAEVASFDQDGFTMNWTSTITSTVHVLYQAYK